MSEEKRQESEITIENIKYMLSQLGSRIDPFEIIEYLEARNIPLPNFDDIEEMNHEFSPEFEEKMAQLLK